MNRFNYAVAVTALAVVQIAPLAHAQAGVSGNENTGYKMKVVSRSTEAVDYRHKGSTKIDIKGTDLAPEISGDAKIEGVSGGVRIETSIEHFRPANSFGLAYLSYVLWAISPQGKPSNLGELVVKDGKASLRATTEFQAFALIVTAEPYFAVSQPSDLVVAQNIVRRDTKGGIEPVEVKYELISRDTYSSQVQPINSVVYDPSNKTPLDLLEARNAVRVAKDAGAAQYAQSELQKAQDLLDRAEDYYRRKQGSGPIGTVAREASQTAEEARVMTIKREQEAEAEAERQAAADRTAKAQQEAADQEAAAAKARANAEQAQAQAQQAQQEAEQAQKARAEALAAQQQADAARQQAEAAQQAAAQQAAASEQARQQAEAEKAQMRARMLAQLNAVLQTRDTARGLIVNMPDVLFATGKSVLQSAARERLSKVSGILLAYPDIKVEVDGYTDSTGTLEFNQKLSQERAESVRTYLTSQGVSMNSITTQGFGPSDPIASNDTAMGRQQNRRVELVVSGASIGTATASPTGGADTTGTAPPPQR